MNLRKFKLNRRSWKKIIYHYRFKRLRRGDEFFFMKNTKISKVLINRLIYLYTGKKWIAKRITKWMRGLNLGAFIWTRRVAYYKKKKKRK